MYKLCLIRKILLGCCEKGIYSFKMLYCSYKFPNLMIIVCYFLYDTIINTCLVFKTLDVCFVNVKIQNPVCE